MATHIKEIIETFLKKKAEQSTEQGRIMQIAQSVFPSAISSQLQVEKVEKEKIVFSCAVPAIRYEVNLKKKEFLTRVREQFPQIREIKIK